MGTISKTAISEIEFFYPRTRALIVIVALLFASQLLPELISNVVAIIVVISIGLMHGATDHILYVNSDEAEFKSKIPRSFIVKYLFILGSMGIIWLLLPSFALVLFLVISAYHFGQTQLQYIPVPEMNWLKKIYYTIWGVLVLCLIVLLNLEESKALIQSAIPRLDLSFLNVNNSQLIIAVAVIATLLSMMSLIGKQSWKTMLIEWIELAVIALLSLQCNLLVSFGIFFGLWHALRASQVQIDKVSTRQAFNPKTFVRESLPFTLISIFGICLMLAATYYLGSEIRSEMLFLVAISMLTLPHMFIYERFYNYFDKHSAQ